MPKLGTGREFAYGWTVLDERGRLRIPPDACREYGILPGDPLVVLGGNEGEGFGVARLETLKRSPMRVILDRYPELAAPEVGAETMVEGRSRYYLRLPAGEEGTVSLSSARMEVLGIGPGTRFLALRGNEVMISFVGGGELFETARDREDLPSWEG
ncbi:MAG TPA: hypothetical protein PLI51_06520 [bacterium]|nr:hypothetical protein [bacterium]HPQ66362.1 hypothetical protein [bacterium]